MSSVTNAVPRSMSTSPSITLATRIHLGKQSSPPDQSKLVQTLSTFLQTASTIEASRALIAVDPEEKIKGYDLVSSIKEALQEARKINQQQKQERHCEIVPVSIWGSFVPALNALTIWACKHQIDYGNTVIMFLSAETTVTKETIQEMSQHMDDDTLVVGAALPGHDYQGTRNNVDGIEVDLNGRTCPWNTTAMWNLNKLALIGFPLVGDGLHQQKDGTPVAGGIEEFATVLLHQKMNPNGSKAKLVKVSGVEWEQTFEDDDRQKWHESKMKSKFTRAEVHRSLLGGEQGKAIHF